MARFEKGASVVAEIEGSGGLVWGLVVDVWIDDTDRVFYRIVSEDGGFRNVVADRVHPEADTNDGSFGLPRAQIKAVAQDLAKREMPRAEMFAEIGKVFDVRAFERHGLDRRFWDLVKAQF